MKLSFLFSPIMCENLGDPSTFLLLLDKSYSSNLNSTRSKLKSKGKLARHVA